MLKKIIIAITIIIVLFTDPNTKGNTANALFFLFSYDDQKKLIIDILYNILAFLPLKITSITLSIGALFIDNKKYSDKPLYILLILSNGWLGFILFLLNRAIKIDLINNKKKTKQITSIMVASMIVSFIGASLSTFIYSYCGILEYHYIDYIELPKSLLILSSLYHSLFLHLIIATLTSLSFYKVLKKEESNHNLWIFATMIYGIIPWVLHSVLTMIKKLTSQNRNLDNSDLKPE